MVRTDSAAQEAVNGSPLSAISREEENRTVKRNVIIAIVALGLGITGYLGSRLVSQKGYAQQPAAVAPQTKVALLNLMQVIKNYGKFTNFQNEVKTLLQPYQDRDKAIKQQIEAHTKELQKPDLQPAQREQFEKNLKAYQRQLEDNSNDAKMVLAKKNDEQMLILYKEVADASQRYAASHGFEMVLHFNDADPATPDYWSPMNVARKMQAGSCMPLYVANGLDITKEIVAYLNSNYRGPTTTQTPAH
jgi:Skp family chaperone for outer membrane proteins